MVALRVWEQELGASSRGLRGQSKECVLNPIGTGEPWKVSDWRERYDQLVLEGQDRREKGKEPLRRLGCTRGGSRGKGLLST